MSLVAHALPSHTAPTIAVCEAEAVAIRTAFDQAIRAVSERLRSSCAPTPIAAAPYASTMGAGGLGTNPCFASDALAAGLDAGHEDRQ